MEIKPSKSCMMRELGGCERTREEGRGTHRLPTGALTIANSPETRNAFARLVTFFATAYIDNLCTQAYF